MQTRLFWLNICVGLHFSQSMNFIPTARIVRDALSNFSFAQISYTPFIFEGQERK